MPKRVKAPISRKRYTTKKPTKRAVIPRDMVVFGKGFPKKALVSHTYLTSHTMTCTSGAMNIRYFRANGMYDPDHTGTGGQPLYFDQLTAVYRHFQVIGSKITIRWSQSSTANIAFRVGCFLNDDTSASSSTYDQLGEQSSAKVSHLGPGSDKVLTMTNHFSTKKIFGKMSTGADSLKGSVSADPTEQALYTLFFQPIDQVTTQNINFTCKIEYLAIWSELQDMARS